MPDDLDELEIRTRREDEQQTGQLGGAPPPRPPGRLLPVLIALVAVAVLAAAAVFIFKYQPWRSRAPVAPSPRPSMGPPASPAPEARGPLPSLDESDSYVRKIAAVLSSSPELARWLAQTALVRTATAVVSNVADGETPRPHLSFLAPRQRFHAAAGPGRRIVADPKGFVGYDRFADTIGSIDTAAAANAYRATEPLFDAACRDLGHPEGFRGSLDRAIDALLAVPVPAPDAELVPHAVGYRWADPRLEGLTAAQKQLLRIGPRNVRIVQEKLRELKAALARSV